jgi:hypothetical protein
MDVNEAFAQLKFWMQRGRWDKSERAGLDAVLMFVDEISTCERLCGYEPRVRNVPMATILLGPAEISFSYYGYWQIAIKGPNHWLTSTTDLELARQALQRVPLVEKEAT